MIQQAISPAQRLRTATTHMAQQRLRYFFPIGVLAIAGLFVAACSGEIYVRDGVTDGDTFYLAERALTDSDPALQSWVSYSLTRSACQLQIGGDNPARATSFECELGARTHLIETWFDQRAEEPDIRDKYLDELTRVRQAGFLAEYVADNFRRRSWHIPPGLDQRGFKDWRRLHLPRHKPTTRLIGSWNYARNVNPARQ